MHKDKTATRRQLLKGGGAALVGLAAGAGTAGAQTLRSTTPEDLARELMAYGRRSRFVKTGALRWTTRSTCRCMATPTASTH